MIDPFICLIVLGLVWLIMSIVKKDDPLKAIPGPPTLPILGNLLNVDSKDLGQACRHLCYQHKWSIFKIKLGLSKPLIILNHPEYVKQIFQHLEDFDRSSIHLNSTSLHGGPTALEVIPNESWPKLRGILDEAFKISFLKDQIPIIKQKLYILTESLDLAATTKQSIDLHPIIVDYALEVLCKFGFGCDGGRQLGPSSQFLFSFWYQMVPFFDFFHYWRYFSTGFVVEMRKHTKRIRNTIQQVVKDRTESGEIGIGQDWLACLVRAQKNGLISEEDVIANGFQLVAAGDTTPCVIGWLIYVLSVHPHVQSKLRENILQTLETKEDYSYSQILSIHYLDYVVREVLRMYPPVGSPVPREVKRDVCIGGYTIPKGSSVAYCPDLLHFNENYWKEPNKFDPDRWLPEVKQTRPSEAYIPFILGRRNCIGQYFGLLETKVVVIELLRRYCFTFDDTTPPPTAISSWIKHPNKVQVKVLKLSSSNSQSC